MDDIRIKKDEVSQLQEQREIVNIENIDDFIDLVRQRKIHNDKFIYLVKDSQTMDNYNLKIISYPQIAEQKMKEYYTLSSRGISLFEEEKLKEFTYLGDWIRERDQYNTIIKYKFFRQFKKWKTLKKWSKQYYKGRMEIIKKKLVQNLFIAHPIYQKILLKHRYICIEMQSLKFMEINNRFEV